MPKNNKSLALPIIFFVVVLFVGGYLLYNKAGWQPTKTSKTNVSLKTFSNENVSFQYPKDWTVTEEDFSDLDPIRIENPQKTVKITVSKTQYPYGIEGEGKEIVQDIYVTVNGKQYLAKEVTLNDEDVFVDFKLDKPEGFNILFGTGYPAADDLNASLADYHSSKEIILTILSSMTFKFTN